MATIHTTKSRRRPDGNSKAVHATDHVGSLYSAPRRPRFHRFDDVDSLDDVIDDDDDVDSLDDFLSQQDRPPSGRPGSAGAGRCGLCHLSRDRLPHEWLSSFELTTGRRRGSFIVLGYQYVCPRLQLSLKLGSLI